MRFDPVHVPRERGWRGRANRLVIWLAHRPATAVALVVVAALVPVLVRAWWTGSHPSHPMLHPAWRLMYGVVMGALTGAVPLLLRAVGRGRMLYAPAVAWCGACVLLPLAHALAQTVELALPGTFGTAPWFDLAAGALLRTASITLAVALSFVWVGRWTREVLRLRDWLFVLALLASTCVALAFLEARSEGIGDAVLAVGLWFPFLLVRAGRGAVWAVVPLFVAGILATHSLAESLRESRESLARAYDLQLVWVLLLPLGFCLGSLPFALLARRADRMTVLPDWE